MVLPAEYYKHRISTLTADRKALRKKHTLVGWMRLLIAIAAVVAFYNWWSNDKPLLTATCAILVAVFLVLVSKALAADTAIKEINRLLEINSNELKILQGNYFHQNDGMAFMQQSGLYDNDLDVFGKASLFQYINRSSGYFAQLSLAKNLTNVPELQIVLERQQAVKELAQKPEWIQHLQAHSNAAPVSLATFSSIKTWLKEDHNSFEGIIWQVLRFTVPIISFTILGLYLTDFLSDAAFNTCMLLMLAFVFAFYKQVTAAYVDLSKVLPEINSFLPALRLIESQAFNAPLLQALQSRLNEPGKASESVAGLKNILKRLEYRLNPVVHIPLNIFLFWDLQQVLALKKWKKQQTAQVENWFTAVAEMEMLSALAVLHFNNPQWTFPEITSEWFALECKQTGHPLLAKDKAVLNDYSMHGTPAVTLLTGSNMAGKSTFLRTIGANMLVGLAGGPVHASYMKLPLARIISSMRITDNLEEGTSTFYAELKKMKRIVDASNAHEKVFILIDEMLRGTNTLDRHTGSIALVKQLVQHDAVAIIASHDIALAKLEETYPDAIANYHFDSTIINNEIVFDYKLKNGVCTSTNASLLMKKIGIEL